jgi:metal-responsive CopG/Arc/MetJ family transcriptional regulator
MSMSVTLPDALEYRIESVYEELGYSSRSEMAKDSVRRHLEHLHELGMLEHPYSEEDELTETGIENFSTTS